MITGRWTRSLAGLLAIATVVALLPATAAEATDVHVRDRQRLLGEVTTARLVIRLADGEIARGDVVVVPDDDPQAVLRPRIARGTVAGTEHMGTLARRELGRGGIVGINGGYRLPRAPWGAPNGLHLDRGRLLQGQAVNSVAGGGRPTGRGMVGWHDSGAMVMDRILVTHELELPDPALPPVRIDELNRQPWPEGEAHRRPDGELLLFDDRFGTTVEVPANSTVLVLDGMSLRSTGATQGQIVDRGHTSSETTLTVPDGRHVLVAHGERWRDVLSARLGDTLTVSTRIDPEASDPSRWDDLDSGVAGGQLMVRDGQRRPADEWVEFAAFGTAHALGRQPRTAIGRTGDGRTLLVTVDGRQTGWSVGLTVRELADTMLALGARDAVNLDGGGSTTMMVEGAVRNRPSESGRAVMDGIFVYVPRPGAARSLTEACPPQLVQTSFTDVPGTTHAEAIGCLAGWGVTTGVTSTTFAPDRRVTRAQLASFLARWIDDAAERGDGAALPAEADLPFGDVRADSVHAPAIARLAAAGVIAGTTATTFDPTAPVTRAQTAALTARALGHVTGEALPRGRDTFTDDNGSTHEHDIDRLATAGVVTGTGGWRFRPADPVRRGAVASILMRGSALLVEAGVVGVPPEPLVVAGTAEADDADDEESAEATDGDEVADEGAGDDPDAADGEVADEGDGDAPDADDGEVTDEGDGDASDAADGDADDDDAGGGAADDDADRS